MGRYHRAASGECRLHIAKCRHIALPAYATAGPGRKPRDACSRRDDLDTRRNVPHGFGPGRLPGGRAARPVTVDGFWMDVTPVTVAAFAAFVADTGYRTVAQRPLDPRLYPGLPAETLVPGSMVFRPTDGPVDLTDWLIWWRYVPGADWAHPDGPGSTAAGRGDHPVVHVCWADVAAYAEWAGKDLPTEAEWERAARGGLDGARYAWGDEFAPDGRLMANTWIGEFPWQNLKPPQIRRTTPVGAFPANGFGLSDITGNVWEWTRDFYAGAA